MLSIYLILTALVAFFWLSRAFSPNSRMAARYLYNRGTSPASLHGTVPHDPTPPVYSGDPAAWPFVTIIVPGRNEGHLLPATLGSLCTQEYPAYRIIFIDDQSTDNTPEVCRTLAAQHPHLTVLCNTVPPPAGWIGKTWAIHQAQSHFTGDYLLFVDSDLRFDPACLKQMVRLALQRQTDLLSLLPFTECHTLGEKLGIMAGLQLIALAHPLRKSNDPRSPNALVAGGFILFRRSAYEALGGHHAVRGQVIEDLALGSLAKRQGLCVFTVVTEDLLRGRMYEGTADTFRGFKKNAYAAANYNPFVAVAFLLALLLFGVLMPLYPLLGIVLWITQPGVATLLACLLGIAAWAAMLVTMIRADRLVKFPDALAWLTPAAAAFFGAIFAASMLDHYRGGNEWSGRKYASHQVATLNSLSAKS